MRQLPLMESLAEEFAGRVRFLKVVVDEDREALDRFGAGGLPTYLLFKDGERVDRIRFPFIGWLLESRVRRMVNGALDGG